MEPTVHHVGIVVRDIERSKVFYALLGFEPEAEKTDERKTLAFLRLGEFRMELFCYHETPPVGASGEPRLGFRHLALSVDDVEAERQRLVAAGAIPADVEVMVTPAGWRLLFFDDPDGIEIELMERGTGL